MIKLSEYFSITYGINLELNKLEECKLTEHDSIPFVARSDKNNGVTAYVRRMEGIVPNSANSISVASGGSSVLASFLQEREYYSGRDLYVLIPKREFTKKDLLFYCMCIKKNRFKYNFGRQANKSLSDILVPEFTEIPSWVNIVEFPKLPSQESKISKVININTSDWKYFDYTEVFSIEKCKCDNANKLLEKGDDINYIGAKKIKQRHNGKSKISSGINI